jgi:hypothetical protein
VFHFASNYTSWQVSVKRCSIDEMHQALMTRNAQYVHRKITEINIFRIPCYLLADGKLCALPDLRHTEIYIIHFSWNAAQRRRGYLMNEKKTSIKSIICCTLPSSCLFFYWSHWSPNKVQIAFAPSRNQKQELLFLWKENYDSSLSIMHKLQLHNKLLKFRGQKWIMIIYTHTYI